MSDKTNIFYENELRANRYSSTCLVGAAIVAVLMWILNILGFFIVDNTVMNIAMPIGIIFLIIPSILIKVLKMTNSWIKYLVIFCFLFGVGIMSTALTIQLVLAWACPILLSCHYYSPKLTKFSFIGVVIFMLISTLLGLYFGVWDSNMMRSSSSVDGYLLRMEFIQNATANGDNILLRVFNFYYIPRAAICGVFFLVAITLSNRTHGLLKQQEKDYLEKERISTELSVATEIQGSMLPSIFPAFPDRPEFDIYATMTPSKEVGGDFYDFFLVDDDHLALVIADVSGKGVPAAMFMMVVKTLIKNNTVSGKSPAEILTLVNNQLCENGETDMFVTVWFGIYEISTGKLTATNAGHEYPFIKTKDSGYTIVKDKHGFVIGGMENSKYTDYDLSLNIGDTFLIYTDGVAEAINIKDDAYGVDRLATVLNHVNDYQLKDLLNSIKNDVDFFAGEAPQFDDITLLSLRRKI